MLFLHMTLLLDLVHVPTKCYQMIPSSMGYALHKISALGEIKYITKTVRVVSLVYDTPTGPPFHPYKTLSKYLKVSKLWKVNQKVFG